MERQEISKTDGIIEGSVKGDLNIKELIETLAEINKSLKDS